MTNRSARALVATIFSVLILISEVWAFNMDTHKLLNLRAADVSALDNSLKKQFGFVGGLSESFDGRQARAWIGEGGAAEDQFLGNDLLGAAFRSIFALGVPVPDAIATAPVARLWDTDQYDGSNPALTLSFSRGLAEHTNANFVSLESFL